MNLSLHEGLFSTENALFKTIGQIFHPIFLLMGDLLAGIYAVIPNYALAIAVLTVVIMAALTPITVKSTKSMLAMQRLQPEMKKLQQKYKGPENREELNREMMRLYKENGTSPFGACLPSFLQMPFLIILYDLIGGLSNKTTGKHPVPAPRYISGNSELYHHLVSSGGKMISFGMDFSQEPFSHHSAWFLTIPYLLLIGAAMFLQYYQMKQMSNRNPQAAAANPQMQKMQKFFPIIFGFFYLRCPAGVTVYMLVSSAIRILTQDVMFRTGMVQVVGVEREIPGTSRTAISVKSKDKTAGVTKSAQEAKGSDGTQAQVSKSNGQVKKSSPGSAGKKPGGPTRQLGSSNTKGAKDDSEEQSASPAKVHPRSKSKRERKAR